MSKSSLVFRNQLARFKQEKGMMFFYSLAIVIMGIIVPIFVRGVESSLTMAALLTATFLKPILSDSVAGEREHRTLETLLSSPMNGKSIIWGKFQFSLFFAVCFFGMTALFAVLTNWFVGNELALTAWQWVGVILLAVLSFSAISIAGVHASATSGDMRVANSRVSRIAYPLGLVFLIYLPVAAILDFYSALVFTVILTCFYLFIIGFYIAKAIKMKQADYYENIKIKVKKVHHNYSASNAPKSQFGIVFGFELKYLMTLKTLLLNFGAMCFAPALIACVLPYYTGTFDLNYAVFMTILLIPRIPTNLIAYSIGGEKVYKTGESLLSTPLHIRSIFLAKCMIPVLVTTVMLMLSSVLTLMGATILGWTTAEILPTYRYTSAQLVMLFPVGILSSMLMMFLSAIFSVVLKTPRHGLYVTSIISFIFVAPIMAIVYLTSNLLLWSVIYAAVLLVCNAICVRGISDKISHPQVVSRL